MSTPTMRAKMRVSDVKPYPETGEATCEGLRFDAVSSDDAYPDDGSDENNTFAKFTPQASLDMTITNPALLGQFKVGDTFYVDFIPAE